MLGRKWLTVTNTMDRFQLRGQNLSCVFNSRIGCLCAKTLHCFETKELILTLKTWHG